MTTTEYMYLGINPSNTPHAQLLPFSSRRPTYLERKLDKPIRRRLGVPQVIQGIARHAKGSIGAQAIFNATGPRSGKGKLGHDAFKGGGVHFLQHTERIARKLNRSAETGKGGRLFVDRHVKALLEHGQGGRQPAHAAAGNRHLEGASGPRGEAQGLGGGIVLGIISISHQANDRAHTTGRDRRRQGGRAQRGGRCHTDKGVDDGRRRDEQRQAR